jgi:hypothetical protein
MLHDIFGAWIALLFLGLCSRVFVGFPSVLRIWSSADWTIYACELLRKGFYQIESQGYYRVVADIPFHQLFPMSSNKCRTLSRLRMLPSFAL